MEDKAFILIIEIVQLSRSGKPYRNLLPELKELLKDNPKAQALVNQLYINLQNLGEINNPS